MRYQAKRSLTTSGLGFLINLACLALPTTKAYAHWVNGSVAALCLLLFVIVLWNELP
jgi:hypothetical protein